MYRYTRRVCDRRGAQRFGLAIDPRLVVCHFEWHARSFRSNDNRRKIKEKR